MEPLGVLALILDRARRNEESSQLTGKLTEHVRLSYISGEWLWFS